MSEYVSRSTDQYSSSPEEIELARRVKLFLASQPRPALRYLRVTARGGSVSLQGVVTTYYERQLALQCSRRVAGVRELIDEIQVVDAPLSHGPYAHLGAFSTTALQPEIAVGV